jgi:predicted DCC family thiol-disulfide oxidoreductase YuxK
VKIDANLQQPTAIATTLDRPIIFFDGVCGMCNAFVDLVLHADNHDTFLFAPLQGETASRMLPPLPSDPREWSLIYLDERGSHEMSDASLEIYKRIGGAWKLLSYAQIVPRVIRDPVYRVIARTRYQFFGKREACRMPSATDQARFLP